MKKDRINSLRFYSRKLIRELGMLQLNQAFSGKTIQHCHALIEISREPDITISKLGTLLLLSVSATSRIVNALIKHELIAFRDGKDRREKYLYLTEKGQLEMENIDEFSNLKIKGAFAFLTEDEQTQVVDSIQKYSQALEKNRLMREHVKIHTLSTSRTLRKQIISMIENIQKHEFSLPITDEINAGILKAEEEFYYNNSYNFWYAVDDNGVVIGSIGLKKIDDQHGEIKKFFVDKKYRERGVAQKLIKTLFKSALKHQFNSLYLGTVATFQAAHRFYEKYGFTRVPQQQLPRGFTLCPVDTVFFKINTQTLSDKLEHSSS